MRTSHHVVVMMLFIACPLRATTFAISYEGRASVDPAASFDVDCAGVTEAPDCDVRAAALETELKETLAALSFESDVETRALFESLLVSDSPQVAALALAYFVAEPPPPQSIWDHVRLFFFGPDPTTGHPAARHLATSLDESEREMSRVYRLGRPDEGHSGALPGGAGETDTWALGIARDVTLDLVLGFAETERFAPAARLLMIDRVLDDFVNPSRGQLIVTGFVTDAPLEDVVAHFTTLFGSAPYVSMDVSLAQQETLLDEMASLQTAIARGDGDALARVVEINEQLQTLQASTTVGTRLQLETLESAAHVFWSAIPVDAAFTAPLGRSVAVGRDTVLERTVIRYVADDPASGVQSDGGDPTPDPEAPACACESTTTRETTTPLFALCGLAVCASRVRRRGTRA